MGVGPEIVSVVVADKETVMRDATPIAFVDTGVGSCSQICTVVINRHS